MTPPDANLSRLERFLARGLTLAGVASLAFILSFHAYATFGTGPTAREFGNATDFCIPEDSTHCTTPHEHVPIPFNGKPCMGGFLCAFGPVLLVLAPVFVVGWVLQRRNRDP